MYKNEIQEKEKMTKQDKIDAIIVLSMKLSETQRTIISITQPIMNTLNYNVKVLRNIYISYKNIQKAKELLEIVMNHINNDVDRETIYAWIDRVADKLNKAFISLTKIGSKIEWETIDKNTADKYGDILYNILQVMTILAKITQP